MKEKIRADLKRYIHRKARTAADDHAGHSGDLSGYAQYGSYPRLMCSRSLATCLARMSHSMLTRSPGLAAGQIRRFVSVGDDRHFHQSVVHLGDRQTDAVNRDRTFIDQKTIESRGNTTSNSQFPSPSVAQSFDHAGPIDVSLYNMPAQAASAA